MVSDRFSLGLHANEVPEYEELDDAVLRDLVKRIANGDTAARTELLRANLRLVIKYASGRYRKLSAGQRQRLDLVDLVQEGYCRLWQKLHLYNPDVSRFSTWATWWLRAAIGRTINEDSRAVHIPSHIADRAREISREIERLLDKGKVASRQELQKKAGIEPDMYEGMERFVLYSNPSLDAPINEESTPLIDVLGETAVPAEQDRWIETSHIQESLLEALWNLSQNNRRMFDVLLLSTGFYYDDDGSAQYRKPLTLRQIGEILGLSAERVRQIKKKAVEFLQSHHALAEFGPQ